MPTKPSPEYHEGQEANAKATTAELDKNWDQAFRSYFRAAECYLHASRTATDNVARAEYKAHAAKALDRAEKIKKLKRDLTPVTVDRFSEQQQYYILDKTSVINGLQFDSWNKSIPPASDSNTQPRLSSEQINCLAEWCRPQDVSPQCRIAAASLTPLDITQHLVADCSVSSSLAVCVEHSNRFGTKLGLSSLYPQDTKGLLCASPDGNYAVQFLFNGTHRRVPIDDKLPYSPDGVPLCMSAIAKGQLWPSLIGKSYMKLMGGYDFPGSNSSIDLHAITGWIPEHLEFRSASFQRENTWHRVHLGFHEGRCLVTIGTDKRDDMYWHGRRLLPAHCYAVIDVQEDNGERMLTLLDPLVASELRDSNRAEDASADKQSSSQDRVWKMSWDDACDVIHSIYLNWDPALFPNQLCFHGIWKASSNSSGDSTRSVHDDLHLRTTGSRSSDLWVVLTRHVVDRSRTSEYIALKVETEDGSTDSTSISKLASQGMYTNSPHTLVRTRLPDPEHIISILVSYEGHFDDTGYTITAYSTATLSWDKTVPPPAHVKNVECALAAKNAGGNCLYPTFMLNPQYHLRIRPAPTTSPHSKSKTATPTLSRGAGAGRVAVDFLVQGERGLPLNVTAVWSQGQRVTELSSNDIAVASGAYTYGLAHARKQLPPGDYTIILSAFSPDQHGPLSLQVECAAPFDLEAIPQEGAGMYNRTVRAAWDVDTAVGGPSFGRYFENPLYSVHVTTQTQIVIRLQLTHPTPRAALNVSLFLLPSSTPSSSSYASSSFPSYSTTSTPTPPQPQLILTSGPYTDAICGVLTPQLAIAPGTYILVPSTQTPGVYAGFRVWVYARGSGVRVEKREGVVT